MSNESPTVYDKILSLVEAVKGVDKTGINKNQGYKFIQSEHLLGVVRQEMVKLGLIVLPEMVDATRQDMVTTVKMVFTVMDVESGDHVSLTFFGQGWDKTDKGIYKAITGAMKYFVMKLIMLGDNAEDPEFDEDEPDTSDRKPRRESGTRTSEKETTRRKQKSKDSDFEGPVPIGADPDKPPLVVTEKDMKATTKSIKALEKYYARNAEEDEDTSEPEGILITLAMMMDQNLKSEADAEKALEAIYDFLWGATDHIASRMMSLIAHFTQVDVEGELAIDDKGDFVLRENATRVYKELYLDATFTG